MSNTPDVNGVKKRFGDNPLLFEIIPPTRDRADSQHNSRKDLLITLSSRVDVSAINLPEVQEESQKNDKGERKSDFKERVPPREYAATIRSDLGDINVVINRVIVQESRARQEDWLRDTFHDYDIKNIVLVGGESSDIDYPGPSVPEGNQLIKEFLNRGKTSDGNDSIASTNYTVGNICISTRRKEDFDETDRMIKKIKSGADFFTTQIVAEKASPVSLMEDLSHELNNKNVDPPVIFWTFSPIEQQKDVNFLRWLGVEIPDDIEQSILGAENSVSASINHAQEIWRAINECQKKLPVKIPVGVNISFMGDRNFKNAIQLAESLQQTNI